MAARTAVTVADVLRLRDAGLSASETWSLLCQATQGLQDLFLSRCVLPQKAVPRITPSGLQLTRFGRVRLELAYADCGEHCDVYVAPERRSGGQVACDASSLEKALIFSLGTALQRAVQSEEVTGGDLEAVLQSMVRPDPDTRASLMDLLDMISEYCKTRAETKPFSHLVTDMYREVLATPPQCLPSNQNVIHPNTVMDSAQRTNSFPKEYQRLDTEERNTKINKSYSLAPKTDRGSRLAPQRAPSRLYRTASSSRDIEPRAKYCCPNTCIGPEFIIKATKPSKCIHIKGVKVHGS